MKIKTWKAKTKDVKIKKKKNAYIITNNSHVEAKLYAFNIKAVFDLLLLCFILFIISSMVLFVFSKIVLPFLN